MLSSAPCPTLQGVKTCIPSKIRPDLSTGQNNLPWGTELGCFLDLLAKPLEGETAVFLHLRAELLSKEQISSPRP